MAPLPIPKRVFNPPQDLPSARSGHPYPLDWWAEGNGRSDRRGYRYDNGLPLPMMLRLVRALSDPGEHVVDPFVGGGTTAIACWQTGRRFTGGDVNPHAVRFTAARLLAEHAWPAERQPTLPGHLTRCADSPRPLGTHVEKEDQMSLAVILMLALVVAIAWRMVRLAVRIVLLVGLVALIAQYGTQQAQRPPAHHHVAPTRTLTATATMCHQP